MTRPTGRTRRQRRRSGSGRRTGGRAPALLLLPSLVGLAFLVLPVVGLLVRTPWRQFTQDLSAGDTWTALRLSLECATAATGVSLLFGVPLAWLLVRTELPGRGLARALVMVPLVLPPVVGGMALLLMFGRSGVLGMYLDRWFGVTLPFTTPGVIMAETFVAMPFLVVSVETALRSLDPDIEEAAATSGASVWQTFRYITLPNLLPAIGAGAVLAWARALGEFGATITFAGDFPGTTQTMPLAVYLAFEVDPQSAIVLSVVLLAVSVAILTALRDRLVAKV
ncbi:molybdate ABC transporter permease subunit [Actinospica durhamensis]|uniref:Molybdenum transport system permease n=1 Tax=Actinospica durhamensis TaxID=1508375 RepID=A0A941EMJ8_9ACTN|nr:molybdate ABC transporter permease subunit [Actinospica durhamensis]MBR7833663.1 molybdate ABC transporter permease subunit [Actinospica durhamensis]